jgi:hypothetical protein
MSLPWQSLAPGLTLAAAPQLGRIAVHLTAGVYTFFTTLLPTFYVEVTTMSQLEAPMGDIEGKPCCRYSAGNTDVVVVGSEINKSGWRSQLIYEQFTPVLLTIS